MSAFTTSVFPRLPRLYCALRGVLPFAARVAAEHGELALPPVERAGTFSRMNLFEVRAEIPAEAVDAVDDVLLELGNDGWSVLQDVIVRRAWIIGIFTGEAEAHARWTEVQPLVAAVTSIGETTVRALADQDWRDSYKAHFKAWKFGRLHWVPVWEREAFRLPAGDSVIWLDPGLAFGTGNHETTRLCVERLVAIAERAAEVSACRVIDAGCGSGILALSAAKMGFGAISAFDNDPEAVRVSEENAALNDASGRVEFFVGDLITGLAGRQAEVVLANIQADVLMRFAAELTRAVAPGGSLVLSGILAIELEKVRGVFSATVPAWKIDSRVMGEWSDVLLENGAP